jgi:high-affinity iron transporter
LQTYAAGLPERQQQVLEATVALLAVFMVSGMLVWMRRNARGMGGRLQGMAGSALAQGSAHALVVMSFLAVAREGVETAMFLIATIQSSGTSAPSAAAGAGAGLILSAGAGYGIYRGGIRIDMAKFFTASGLVLVVVAAGLVSSVLHTAQEAGWVAFGAAQALDLSSVIRPDSALEALFTGALGIHPKPSVLEVSGWLVYAVPTLIWLVWPQRANRKPASSTASTGKQIATA